MKHQEIDLKTLVDEFLSHPISRANDKSSIDSESSDRSSKFTEISIEDCSRRDLLENPSISHFEPLVEEKKLKQMLSTNFSLEMYTCKGDVVRKFLEFVYA